MRILTFKIPETEHVPASEREEILRRCLASPRLRRCRLIAIPISALAPVLIGFGFIWLAMGTWKWNLLKTFLASFAIIFACVIICTVTRLAIELRILRRLAEKQARR